MIFDVKMTRLRQRVMHLVAYNKNEKKINNNDKNNNYNNNNNNYNDNNNHHKEETDVSLQLDNS